MFTFGERMKLRPHTGMCSGCANFQSQLPHLRQAARDFAARDRTPPSNTGGA